MRLLKRILLVTVALGAMHASPATAFYLEWLPAATVEVDQWHFTIDEAASSATRYFDGGFRAFGPDGEVVTPTPVTQGISGALDILVETRTYETDWDGSPIANPCVRRTIEILPGGLGLGDSGAEFNFPGVQSVFDGMAGGTFAIGLGHGCSPPPPPPSDVWWICACTYNLTWMAGPDPSFSGSLADDWLRLTGNTGLLSGASKSTLWGEYFTYDLAAHVSVVGTTSGISQVPVPSTLLLFLQILSMLWFDRRMRRH